MTRRLLLSLAAWPLIGPPASWAVAAPASAPPGPSRTSTSTRTHWVFRTSQGLEAIAFLGPLSGKPFYARHYARELSEFKPRLAATVLEAIDSLFAEADAAGTLLWPWVALVASGGDTDTLEAVLRHLADDAAALEASFRTSPYAAGTPWERFRRLVPRLREVLAALAEAGFAEFHRRCFADAAGRIEHLQHRFASIDVVAELERLVARRIEPRLELNLLWFCRPHGVKLQGQRFIAQADAPDRVFVLTAAHEPLHPPFDMQGAVGRRCIETLAADPLIRRILAEKDRDSGYNSVEGLFEEGVVQALDQAVQERLGFARPGAARWRDSDGGIHVIAAALHGLLAADGFFRDGGDIEAWLGRAVASGRLAPARLHEAAAAVRGQTVAELWTGPPAPASR
ncbi:MAG: hypothetical protein HZC37_21270 [Burkholderiales bacterium]|nr:hypothetical protein [Burkholderiales bacterium]